MSNKVRVMLLGEARELSQARKLEVDVEASTPIEVIQELAKANPLLKEQIIRGDGTPRLSTKLLINGTPPTDFNQKLDFENDVVIVAAVHACDG